MNFDQMVIDAIDEAAENTGDSEHRNAIILNAEEILQSIRKAMNANGVVFYQP